MKIGFIGLGNMGAGMALNLRKAGHELVVHDMRSESAEPLLAQGATWASSVEELGHAVDVVFTSLPGPRQVEALGLGDGGLLHSLRSGAVWFDLSSNSPTVVQAIGAKLGERGIVLLDSPVSGGPPGARSGKLALYVGGEREVFDRHRALLDALGDRVMYVGELGAGSTAKIVHNLISLVVRMAIAEGMSLGVKAGLDPLELWYAVRQGAIGRARTLDLHSEMYLRSEYEPAGFALELAMKDFTLAMDLAQELDVPMKQAEAAFLDVQEAMARGWARKDSRISMQLQNERAGVQVKAPAEDVQRMLARG